MNFSSAEDFLKAYRKGDFEVIFLDVCMGEMDGLALAEQLRIADREIGIIFMSTTRDFVFQSFPFQPKGYLCTRGSAGEYQADERAGVAGLSWRVSVR